MSQFKQLFIGGCPRSGTTLLARMLSGTPDAAVTPESQFKDILLGQATAALNREQVALLHRHWQRRAWNLPALRHWPWRSKNRVQFLEWLVRQHMGQPEGELLWIDHSPNNLALQHELRLLFPESRFLHIVRDPRAVFASVRRLDWGRSTPAASARWWLQRHQRASAACSKLGQHSLSLRFEDLVSEPEATLAEVSDWLGRPFPISKLPALKLPRYTQKQHQLVNGAILARRAEAWQDELSEREVEIIEAIVGAELDQLGYRRCFAEPRSPSPLETGRAGLQELLRRGLIDRLRRQWRRSA